MYYKKKEEYSFSMPREYKAYLAFRDKLKETNIRFTEEGGNTTATISVITRGDFEMDEAGNIIELN